MSKKLISTIFLVPFLFLSSTYEAKSIESEKEINKIARKSTNTIYIDLKDIENLVLKNNPELKSLEQLISSQSFNLSSKIAKRYPSLNLNANGLPQYLNGKTYNSNSVNTKSSRFSANPSLTIRWNLIDPQRGPEIRSARNNYEIALNNFEIKKKDLIQEARASYHKLQKSYEDIKNAKISIEISKISLKDAQAKLETGIGTRFEVLEAETQLARDQESLNEKKIQLEINEIILKEILNINTRFDIDRNQKLIGFWNYSLEQNIKSGIKNSKSLKNISLQETIRENQANFFNNASKPLVYISNTFSSTFTKGDYLSTSIDPNEYGSSYSNTIGLNFSWNIFNGGQNKNSYKSKKTEAKSERFAYKNIENMIKTNISETFLNLKINTNKILSSKQEIISSQESLRLTRLRYEVGISTLKDVLIRQKELSDARSKKIASIFNYNLNLDKLERLTFMEKDNTCRINSINKSKRVDSICDI